VNRKVKSNIGIVRARRTLDFLKDNRDISTLDKLSAEYRKFLMHWINKELGKTRSNESDFLKYAKSFKNHNSTEYFLNDKIKIKTNDYKYDSKLKG